MASRPALVLDDPSLASDEVHVFANFPGRWAPGEPVAVSELGFDSDADAYALVEELGLPLASTSVGSDDGFLLLPDNHALNQDQMRLVEQTGDEVLAAAVPNEPASPEDLLAAHAPDVVATVATVEDAARLDELERAETAGKGRSSVLQAITDQRATLAAPQGLEV